MRTRDHDIVRQETQTSDSTSKTWDLSYTDPISAILLEFQATNGTTSNKGNLISDVITKVEIVDGSKPLVSVNMFELEMLHFLKQGITPALFPSEWASCAQRHAAYLLFGRKLWDTMYAFDCKRYKNPQLKITWNLGVVRTVATDTAFATGTLKITACAKVMEELPAPVKFLSAKQVETFTMPTSGSHKTEMYTDYPWRLLLIRCYLQGYDINEMISYLTLDCDAGKFKPLDTRYVADLDEEALALFGASRVKHDIFESHQDKIRLLHNKEPDLRPYYQSLTQDNIVGIDYQWSSEAKLNMFNDAGSALTTDQKITAVEEGHALHAILPIPFGDKDKMETWFDATKYGKIDLNLYAPSTGYAGVSSVVLEQERPNGE